MLAHYISNNYVKLMFAIPFVQSGMAENQKMMDFDQILLFL